MATLLIVEDDHKTNEAVCEYLRPTDHTVIPAYDGGEALQLFQLMVSMFWKNALLPFVINFALCTAMIVSGAACAYSNFLWTKVLNPYSLLTNRVLLDKTEFVSLGGFPVLTWQTAGWIALIVGLTVATAIYFLSAENCHRCVRRAK